MTFNNITPEMIEKAQSAANPMELLKMAEEEGIMLTESQAAELFEKLQPPMGELDDDELDNVAGGACGKKKTTIETYGFIQGQRVQNSGERKFVCGRCTLWRNSPFGAVFNVEFCHGYWTLRCYHCSNPYRAGREFTGDPRSHGLKPM